MVLLFRLASYATLLAFAGVASAQTPSPATGAAKPPSAGVKPAATPSTSAPANAPASPAAPVMSESKFLGALYSEIEKHTPVENALGDGEVTASFHVNAAGRIDRVVINKSSSPTHADAVKQILGAVVAPPPPGGSMDVGQIFKFHKPEPEEAPTPAPASSPAAAPPASATGTKPAPAAPAR